MSCTQPFLTRRTQFAAKVQVDCETPATIDETNVIEVYSDAAVAYDLQVNDRTGLASNSLSNRTDVFGRLTGTLTAKAEMIGLVDGSTKPELDPVLISSGMVATAVEKTGLAGPVDMDAGAVGYSYLEAGIELFGATSSATALLVVPIRDGDAAIYATPLTSTFQSGEVISERVGTATATAAANDIFRAGISAIIGGSFKEGDILVNGVNEIKISRCTKNGDAYMYYTVLAGSVTLADEFTYRNKQVTIKSAQEAVKQIPATFLSTDYNLRQGVTVTETANTGVVLITFNGAEPFLYVDGVSPWEAATILSTPTVIETSDSVPVPGGFKYTYISGDQSQITASLNVDGYQKTLWNAASSFTVDAEANNIPFFNASIQGTVLQTQTGDVAQIADVPFNDVEPTAFNCAELIFKDGSQQFTPVVKSVSLDSGNSIIVRDDANSCTGVKGTLITARNPIGSLEVEQVAAADWDYVKRYFSGATAGIEWKFSSECGQQIWVIAPKTQYSDVSQGDTDGVASNSISYGLKGTDGDDELSIVYVV